MPASALPVIPCGNGAGVALGRAQTPALRLLTPGDEPIVRTGFVALSPTSRHLRYGLPVCDADRALEWVRLLGNGTHVALGACTENGEPVGLARYVRRSDSAEVAVTVLDAWQNRGVGTLLLESLCTYAQGAGISALRASILAENRRALKLAQGFGARRSGRDGGMLEYELQLLDPQMRRQSRRPCLDASHDHGALS